MGGGVLPMLVPVSSEAEVFDTLELELLGFERRSSRAVCALHCCAVTPDPLPQREMTRRCLLSKRESP